MNNAFIETDNSIIQCYLKIEQYRYEDKLNIV